MLTLYQCDIKGLDGIEGQLFGEVIGISSYIDPIGVVDLNVLFRGERADRFERDIVNRAGIRAIHRAPM